MKKHDTRCTARVLAANWQAYRRPLDFRARLGAAVAAAILTAGSASAQQYIGSRTEFTGNTDLRLERISSIWFHNGWTGQEESMTTNVNGRIFNMPKQLVRFGYRAVHNPSTPSVVMDVNYPLYLDGQFMGNLVPSSNLVVTPRGSFKSSIPSGRLDSGIDIDLVYSLQHHYRIQVLNGLVFHLEVLPSADITAQMTTQWSPTSLDSSGVVQAKADYGIRSTILLPPDSGLALVQGNGDGHSGSNWQSVAFGTFPISHVGVGEVAVFGYFRFSPQAYDMFVQALFPLSRVRFGAWRTSNNVTSYLVNDVDNASVWTLLDV